MDVEEDLRTRYLRAADKVASIAGGRGDDRTSVSIRVNELSVALTGGDIERALSIFDTLSDAYATDDQTPDWVTKALTWASGQFADYFRAPKRDIIRLGGAEDDLDVMSP
jgi:hypothetical protein